MTNKLDHPIATDSECRIINKMLDMECRIDHKIDDLKDNMKHTIDMVQNTLFVGVICNILCIIAFGYFSLLNLKHLIRLMEG